jgi:hypothetical protein
MVKIILGCAVIAASIGAVMAGASKKSGYVPKSEGSFELNGRHLNVTFFWKITVDKNNDDVANVGKVIITDDVSGKIFQLHSFNYSPEETEVYTSAIGTDIRTMDLNFDDYLDIMLPFSQGSGSVYYYVYLYNPATNQFDFEKSQGIIKIMGSIIFTEFETKSIFSFHRVGGGDYFVGVYQWQNGKFAELPNKHYYGGFVHDTVWTGRHRLIP